jgi:hypothetical protein
MAPVDNDHPKDLTPHSQFHQSASSVVATHGFSLVFIQACIAILITFSGLKHMFVPLFGLVANLPA